MEITLLATGNQAIRERARHAGQQIQTEDGVARAVEVIGRYLGLR